MEAYSMDLRRRVIADSDEGLGTNALAKKYRVSSSWERNLKRRRRETGEIGPRSQRVHHETKLDDHLEQLQALIRQQPDATLAELREQLGIAVSVSTIWRVLKHLGVTLKKDPTCRRARPARRSGRTCPMASRDDPSRSRAVGVHRRDLG